MGRRVRRRDGMSWWRPVRSAVPEQQYPRLVYPEPPTLPNGIPAIPTQPTHDDNAHWLLDKMSKDRQLAFEFIQQQGLGHEFLVWRANQ